MPSRVAHRKPTYPRNRRTRRPKCHGGPYLWVTFDLAVASAAALAIGLFVGWFLTVLLL